MAATPCDTSRTLPCAGGTAEPSLQHHSLQAGTEPELQNKIIKTSTIKSPLVPPTPARAPRGPRAPRLPVTLPWSQLPALTLRACPGRSLGGTNCSPCVAGWALPWLGPAPPHTPAALHRKGWVGFGLVLPSSASRSTGGDTNTPSS